MLNDRDIELGWPIGLCHRSEPEPRRAPEYAAARLQMENCHRIPGDVNRSSSSGVHVRLTVRIELSHDRVFAHTIDNCLDNIVYASHSLYTSLSAVTDHLSKHARNYLETHNGSSAIKSVELLDFKMLRRLQQSRFLHRNRSVDMFENCPKLRTLVEPAIEYDGSSGHRRIRRDLISDSTRQPRRVRSRIRPLDSHCCSSSLR